eukprot:6205205-Pleurochrysis_carterae.AAC.2
MLLSSRAGNKENAAAVSELEAQVQSLNVTKQVLSMSKQNSSSSSANKQNLQSTDNVTGSKERRVRWR